MRLRESSVTSDRRNVAPYQPQLGSKKSMTKRVSENLVHRKRVGTETILNLEPFCNVAAFTATRARRSICRLQAPFNRRTEGA